MRFFKIVGPFLFFAVVAGFAAGASNSAAAAAKPAKKIKKTDSKTTVKKTDAGKILFSFENGLEGWKVPEWAYSKKDNAVVDVSISQEQASQGKQSIRVVSDFVAKMWSGAYVEIERSPGDFLDLSGYDTLKVDIYLAPDAPRKLKGELVLSVGEDWSWTEMRKAIELTPGGWTTVTADISGKSLDWKIPMTDAVRGDVRKLGVRVQSNYIEYKGSIYIDNIRLAKAP